MNDLCNRLRPPSHHPSPDPSSPIKLFGQMIAPHPSMPSLAPTNIGAHPALIQQDQCATLQPDEHCLSPRGVEELGLFSGGSSLSDDANTPSLSKRNFEQGSIAVGNVGTVESKEDGTSDAPHRPKDSAPCPRCRSSDTKFCYFNNYNVNQPRHFCKGCQRYWTAGGTLRNVPVGAGRRKCKRSSKHRQSFHHHVVLSKDQTEDGGQTVTFVSRRNPSLHVPSWNSVPSSGHNDQDLARNFNRRRASIKCGESLRNGYNGAVVDAEIKGPSDLPEISNLSKATLQHKDGGGSVVTSSPSNSSSDVKFADERNLSSAENYWPAVSSSCVFPFFGLPWPYMYMTMAGAAAAGNPSLGATSFRAWDGATGGLWQWPILPGGMNTQNWSIQWDPQWAADAVGTANADRSMKRRRASLGGMGECSLYIPKSLRIHDPEAGERRSILETLGIHSESGFINSRQGIFTTFQPRAEVFQPQPGSKVSARDEKDGNQGSK